MSSWYILKSSLVFSPEKIYGRYTHNYVKERNVGFQVAFTVALYNFMCSTVQQDASHLIVLMVHFAKVM